MLRQILGKKDGCQQNHEIPERERRVVEKCCKAVSKLEELNINFLALDFDLTTIDVHTGGKWEGTPDELASHIRPIFKHLIARAHAANIAIAIVTFSPQVRHIGSVLDKTFPEFGSRIPIRGRDRSWTYEGVGCKDGKQVSFVSMPFTHI
uniref:Uncharacterized protein n=1 Tax=Corethron hystrix TaxID=216773 RepID=A0A7S1BZL6_9STRA|mmetsp:Transcript_646/g.1302  ORF Transcript_646/g.1302 Transcript_646/m.1302 type:complete len:150 (+) Transcript_646:330-779(+)